MTGQYPSNMIQKQVRLEHRSESRQHISNAKSTNHDKAIEQRRFAQAMNDKAEKNSDKEFKQMPATEALTKDRASSWELGNKGRLFSEQPGELQQLNLTEDKQLQTALNGFLQGDKLLASIGLEYTVKTEIKPQTLDKMVSLVESMVSKMWNASVQGAAQTSVITLNETILPQTTLKLSHHLGALTVSFHTHSEASQQQLLLNQRLLHSRLEKRKLATSIEIEVALVGSDPQQQAQHNPPTSEAIKTSRYDESAERNRLWT